jgi:thiamine pyrophosphate-dependent acetolactate synthase large subunit-like protein
MVKTPGELRRSIADALAETKPAIVNVMIEPSGNKKLVKNKSYR